VDNKLLSIVAVSIILLFGLNVAGQIPPGPEPPGPGEPPHTGAYNCWAYDDPNVLDAKDCYDQTHKCGTYPCESWEWFQCEDDDGDGWGDCVDRGCGGDMPGPGFEGYAFCYISGGQFHGAVCDGHGGVVDTCDTTSGEMGSCQAWNEDYTTWECDYLTCADPTDPMSCCTEVTVDGPGIECRDGNWWQCQDDYDNDRDSAIDCDDGGDCPPPEDYTRSVCGDSSTFSMMESDPLQSQICPPPTPSLAPAKLCSQDVTYVCAGSAFMPTCTCDMNCDEDCMRQWDNWWNFGSKYDWYPCPGAKYDCECEPLYGATCDPNLAWNDPNNPCPGRCKEHFEYSCGPNYCTRTSLGYQCEPMCWGGDYYNPMPELGGPHQCCEDQNCRDQPSTGGGPEGGGCGSSCYCRENTRTCPGYTSVKMECMGCPTPVQKTKTEGSCTITYYEPGDEQPPEGYVFVCPT